MRNTMNLAWRLLIIALAAGLVLGLVNEITKGPITEQNQKSANESRFAAFPGAKAFEALRKDTENAHDFYLALNEKGEQIGYVASSREYGYRSEIEVVVGMDLKGNIVGVVIGENGDFSETAGLGAKVKEARFAKQFIGIKYDGTAVDYNAGGGGYIIPAGSITALEIESDGSNPDAISGATYSSGAVLTAFNNAASALYELIPKGGETGGQN